MIERIPSGGIWPGVPVTGADRAIVVRRRDIDRRPRPLGGDFAARPALPFPIPRSLAGVLSVFCANTTDRVVALTFDDGPHPEHTPRILDVLASRGARATFFVLARQVEAHPDVAHRIVAEGHELALHGQDHQSLLTMGSAESIARIRRARDTVEALTGSNIALYRPPYGQNTLRQGARIRRLGLENVAWSSDAVDWIQDDESAIAERSLAGLFPGAILLLHDDRGDPENLGQGESAPVFDRALVSDLVLEAIADGGYRTLTVSELLADFPLVRSVAERKRQSA